MSLEICPGPGEPLDPTHLNFFIYKKNTIITYLSLILLMVIPSMIDDVRLGKIKLFQTHLSLSITSFIYVWFYLNVSYIGTEGYLLNSTFIYDWITFKQSINFNVLIRENKKYCIKFVSLFPSCTEHYWVSYSPWTLMIHCLAH